MKNASYHRHSIVMVIAVTTLACWSVLANAQLSTQVNSAARTFLTSQGRAAQSSHASPQLIQPEELAAIVQSSKGPKPLILYVGFRVLYLQAHIPRSEYIGPTSTVEGIQQLRKRVQNLPKSQFVVLYCGCCPWTQCPNVAPAYKQMRSMGFSNVRVLYIPQNFGANWVDKGYPVARGE